MRKRRLDLGLVQRQVAERLGAHTSTVTNWELDRTSPALRFLPSIVALLGFDPSPCGSSVGERLKAAVIYVALGDKYRAFELLKKALVESSDPQQYLKVDPALDPIRSDPRFPLLLKRFGLE